MAYTHYTHYLLFQGKTLAQSQTTQAAHYILRYGRSIAAGGIAPEDTVAFAVFAVDVVESGRGSRYQPHISTLQKSRCALGDTADDQHPGMTYRIGREAVRV